MTSYSRYSAFEALTRKHGVVCVPPDDVSVEDLVIATGNIVGTDKVRAASRMNKRVVIFVSETELVHEIVSTGLSTDDGHFVLVSTLDTPAVKVIISNAPPFLKNQMLISELSRYGPVVSQITMLPLRIHDDRTKHVMSFRRQAYVVLPRSNAERTLNIVLKLKIDLIMITKYT